MFTTSAYIRKNTPELRERLRELGYEICSCTEFEGAVWLSTYAPTNSAHGIGCFGDDEPYKTQEEALVAYEHETEDIDCGSNETLFLAIAALRNDSDYMQWFCNYRGENWVLCLDEYNPKHEHRSWGLCTGKGLLHKASVEELVKHFNK